MTELIHTTSAGLTYIMGRIIDCKIGRNGIVVDKHEGDGCMPAGEWSLGSVFYRPDRVSAPDTVLPKVALEPQMGWCDAPDSPFYNQLISKPFEASHEDLWREDHRYDILITTSHNTNPTIPGAGSAIFIHLIEFFDNKPLPTAGCLALTPTDMLTLLKLAKPDSTWRVDAP